MKIKPILLLALISVSLVSCVKEYLDPYPQGDISSEDLWKNQDYVQGLVGKAYADLPLNYNDIEGAYLDVATDNAVATDLSNNMRQLALGTITTNDDPFLTFWYRNYNAIRSVNIFLKDNRGFKTRFLINPEHDKLLRKTLQGEAYALRAWFEWDLLQKFGGRAVDGQLLGFPILKEPIPVDQIPNASRNTYAECVQQIISDCDSAFKYLPLANRDFLTPTDQLTVIGGRNWGRMDGITTRAIKAMVYLTWASPRFNPSNDIARWDSAAVNAKKVMDFKLFVDNVTSGFNAANGVSWFDPNSPEIVFGSRPVTANDAMERLFYPAGFQGNGSIGATQELVNAFPMANGYPIGDSRSGYNPQNPYAGRDPRFYSTIFYNDSKAYRNNTVSATPMYTFQNHDGGKDAADLNSKNSRTNYHIKKFVFMGLNFSDPTVSRQPHSKFYIRWAHMVLTFAEAANQVVGPANSVKYGISAKTAIQYLRTRKTYDNANGITADPYLNEVSVSKTAFDDFIKNERRIETCFEGMRFYDLRRWTTSLADLNKAVSKAVIVKNSNSTFTYNLNTKLEERKFTSAYLPIPYIEILRMSNLKQNEGWGSWQ